MSGGYNRGFAPIGLTPIPLWRCDQSFVAGFDGGFGFFACVSQSDVPDRASSQRRLSQCFHEVASVISGWLCLALSCISVATWENASARILLVLASIILRKMTFVPTAGNW